VSVSTTILGVGSSTWVASEGSTDTLRLNTAESLELVGLHRDLGTEANLASGPLNKRHTIRVQRLVY
jgi:hypothetical protein